MTPNITNAVLCRVQQVALFTLKALGGSNDVMT